jgi:hypothetical protein
MNMGPGIIPFPKSLLTSQNFQCGVGIILSSLPLHAWSTAGQWRLERKKVKVPI